MSVRHETLRVEQRIAASVDRVIAAWRDSKSLARRYLPGDDGWGGQVLGKLAREFDA